MIGSLLKAGMKTAKALPFTAAAVGLEGMELAEPAMEALVNNPLKRQIKDELTQQANDLAARRKAERYRQLVAINTARLAQSDPHLYNEVMAGRRLAQGTRLFGGTPRQDLMDSLAARMATGQYQQQPSVEELMGGLN